jgi:hypothetical protein
VKSKKILTMKVTDDEHVHDSKALPELVNEIVKSNKIIGKLLFADDSPMKVIIFLDICPQTMESCPCIEVRKNTKIKLKDGNFIRNLLLYLRKRICKSGKRIALLDTDKDGS